MADYRLSNTAKEDLIRIHHFGVEKFGINQADQYFESFFDYFEIIAQGPFSFESVDYIESVFKVNHYPLLRAFSRKSTCGTSIAKQPNVFCEFGEANLLNINRLLRLTKNVKLAMTSLKTDSI